jgi:hypothetical protein
MYLRDKIKKVVKKEDDLNKIMDFIYWEISKLDGKTDHAVAVKVRNYISLGKIKNK